MSDEWGSGYAWTERLAREMEKPPANCCDGCGQDRPTYKRGPEGLGFCFLCVKEDERGEGDERPY